MEKDELLMMSERYGYYYIIASKQVEQFALCGSQWTFIQLLLDRDLVRNGPNGRRFVTRNIDCQEWTFVKMYSGSDVINF